MASAESVGAFKKMVFNPINRESFILEICRLEFSSCKAYKAFKEAERGYRMISGTHTWHSESYARQWHRSIEGYWTVVIDGTYGFGKTPQSAYSDWAYKTCA